MNTASRIPAPKGTSYHSMSNWYGLMAQKDLLFHPDDSPEEIVRISDGTPKFNRVELVQLNEIMREIFGTHGDRVYEAAYPHFMKALEPYPVG